MDAGLCPGRLYLPDAVDADLPDGSHFAQLPGEPVVAAVAAQLQDEPAVVCFL